MNRPAEPESGKPVDGPIFFSTPELTQRVDLLRHLADNSELIPLVRAEPGAGKTTLLYRLVSVAGDNWEICRIDANPLMHPDQLLARLVQSFGGNDLDDPTLDTVVEATEFLRAHGQLPVILVDDAHDLPPASLILLLRLSERRVHDIPVASIVLFADLKISQVLVGPQFLAMNLQALHTLDIPRLRPAQIPRYVQFRLQAKGVDAAFPLEPGQAERLFKESGGLPGPIDELVMKMIKQTHGGKGRNKRSSMGLGAWLTVPRIAVALSVILLLAAVLLFQDQINALFGGGTTELRAGAKPSLGNAQFGEPAKLGGSESQAVDTRSLSLPIPQDGSASLAKPAEALVVGSDGDGSSGRFEDPASRVTAAVEDLLLPQVSPSAGSEATQPAQAPTESATTSAPAVELGAKPSVEEPAIAEKTVVPKTPVPAPAVAAARSKQIGQTEVVKTRPLEPATRARTPSATATPPRPPVSVPTLAYVEVVPPMPKPEVSVEERDLTSAPAKAASATVVKEEVQVPPAESRVALVSEASSAQSEAKGGLLGVPWLKGQNPAYFTLQLLSVSSEQALLEFARKHGVERKGAYFKTARNGKPIYSLVYGAYPSKEAAEGQGGAAPGAAFALPVDSIHGLGAPRYSKAVSLPRPGADW